MNQDWVNEWCIVGVAADVPRGAVTQKRIGSHVFALFNLDGDFFARADACDRCEQPLSDGQVDGTEVECSGCGHRISIAEESDSNPVSSIPVMVVDEEIFVWIENKP